MSQREGRFIRQGNENPEVEIYTYVTENTFDSYLYQLVENKQKFIGQIMTSTPENTVCRMNEFSMSPQDMNNALRKPTNSSQRPS